MSWVAGLQGIPPALFSEFQKRIIAITVTTVLGGAGIYIVKSEKDIAVRHCCCAQSALCMRQALTPLDTAGVHQECQ